MKVIASACRRRCLATVLLASWLAGATDAQSASSEFGTKTLPNGLRILTVQVDKAEKMSLALALPVGWSHDPSGQTGLAEVMRWWFSFVQRDRTEAERFQVTARSDHSVVWYSGPKKFFPVRLGFLTRLLAGKLVGDADLHALALGRARLLADDQAWLVPGNVIRQKAWRSLCEGGPLGRQNYGIPAEIGRLSLEAVRNRARSQYGPDGAALVMIGDFTETRLEDVTSRLGQLPKRAADRRTATHDTAPPFEPSATHERVDGPYVSAALLAPAPSHPDFLSFVVGMTLLRSMAHVRFGAQRGNEWKAEFPYVAFRYWDGVRLVFVNRRGHNASSAAGPKSEIEDLMKEVYKNGFRASGLAAARSEVASILAVPPFDHASGPLLAVRARRLAMSLCLEDWPLDLVAEIEKVGVADVQRVMRDFLAPARLRWFELTPTPETVKFLRTRRR